MQSLDIWNVTCNGSWLPCAIRMQHNAMKMRWRCHEDRRCTSIICVAAFDENYLVETLNESIAARRNKVILIILFRELFSEHSNWDGTKRSLSALRRPSRKVQRISGSGRIKAVYPLAQSWKIRTATSPGNSNGCLFLMGSGLVLKRFNSTVFCNWTQNELSTMLITDFFT